MESEDLPVSQRASARASERCGSTTFLKRSCVSRAFIGNLQTAKLCQCFDRKPAAYNGLSPLPRWNVGPLKNSMKSIFCPPVSSATVADKKVGVLAAGL